MVIAQVCLGLAILKGDSKMCRFITQHNATDVASFVYIKLLDFVL